MKILLGWCKGVYKTREVDELRENLTGHLSFYNVSDLQNLEYGQSWATLHCSCSPFHNFPLIWGNDEYSAVSIRWGSTWLLQWEDTSSSRNCEDSAVEQFQRLPNHSRKASIASIYEVEVDSMITATYKIPQLLILDTTKVTKKKWHPNNSFSGGR